jgi:hypothetical protein
MRILSDGRLNLAGLEEIAGKSNGTDRIYGRIQTN